MREVAVILNLNKDYDRKSVRGLPMPVIGVGGFFDGIASMLHQLLQPRPKIPRVPEGHRGNSNLFGLPALLLWCRLESLDLPELYSILPPLPGRGF